MDFKSLLFIICLINFAFANDDDCDSLLEFYKRSFVCCRTPSYSYHDIYKKCLNGCETNEEMPQKKRNCTWKCYSDAIGLVVDGTVNKTSAVKCFVENTRNMNDIFEKSLSDGVEKCEILARKDIESDETNFERNIFNFLSCVTNYVRYQCPEVTKLTPGCTDNSSYVNNCLKNQTDCETWPDKLEHPLGCCIQPTYYTLMRHSECFETCFKEQRKEVVNCTVECYFYQLGVVEEEKLNFLLAKKLLANDIHYTPEWINLIDTAIDKCETDGNAIKCH